MTSETEYDIYRGEMHVKHIDIVQIDGKTIERVIETPFTIAIRLPKYLAVSNFLVSNRGSQAEAVLSFT